MVDQKISELSAQPSAADEDLLAIVDDPGGAAVTNKITKANFLGVTTRVLSQNATVVDSALTAVSGLSLAVSAGGIYKFDSLLIVNRGTASAITGWGLSFPTMNRIRGIYHISFSAVQAGTIPTVGGTGARVTFTGNSASGSVLLSTTSAAGALKSTMARIDAIMNVQSDGVIQILAKAASAGASGQVQFIAGSYMQVQRLN